MHAPLVMTCVFWVKVSIEIATFNQYLDRVCYKTASHFKFDNEFITIAGFFQPQK